MSALIDIIIPSYNNPQMLISCLNSLKLSMYGPMNAMVNIIVVNNGNKAITEYLKGFTNVLVVEPGKNLGWEGGLEEGLKHSDAPLVVFSNDDIRAVTGQKDLLWKMASLFNDPSVGAVGPSSNFVMGCQNIFADIQEKILDVKYLIGFFIMVRREALDKSGGVDTSCPGGDDIDLSIRIRDAGYKLLARRDCFVFHHGQVTGQKVHGEYWNSPTMQEKTNLYLIKKHGMMKFWETMVMGHVTPKNYSIKFADSDIEGDICRQYVVGDRVLELGCGSRKTVPFAVGMDLINKDSRVPFIDADDDKSVADISGDVSQCLPVDKGSQDTIIARHILEHCPDTVMTLSHWNDALKMGGRLIVALPHNGLGNTVLMNPEHVHAFTPNNLTSLAALCGFEEDSVREDVNGVSFVSIFTKRQESLLRYRNSIQIPAPLGSALSNQKETACV